MKTVALDFDGVLHSYTSGWTGPVPTDPPEPGAVEFCRSLQDAGFALVVVTPRAQTELGQAATEEWLERHGFPEMVVTAQKVPAIAYVDDRAVPYVRGDGDGLGFAAAIAGIGRLTALGAAVPR